MGLSQCASRGRRKAERDRSGIAASSAWEPGTLEVMVRVYLVEAGGLCHSEAVGKVEERLDERSEERLTGSPWSGSSAVWE